jgi:phosphoglycerate dehydrogenase-like enzyme
MLPFDTTVTMVARTARADAHGVDELPALLPEHDVVVVVVPLTDATRGMVDAAFLARMADGALFVNAARGPVTDTDALLAELRSGRLRAAVDVTDPEPLPADHPLWDAPNLLLTPHVGGAVPGFPARAYALVRRQLERWVAGEPLENVVHDGY